MANEREVLKRVDDQIAYYGRRSRENRTWYYVLALVGVIAAAAVPVLALTEALPQVTATVGALIVVIQGAQLLFQFQQNWTNYRVTGEALKQERALFQGDAGPYRRASDARALFVERTEAVMRREHAAWEATRKDEGQRTGTRPGEAPAGQPPEES
jgi:hypothetical protein